jgi:hypothetical protein
VNGSRARFALVLLNVALFGAIVYLGQHAARRATADHEVAGPLPVEYAVADGRGEATSDPSREIGAQLDRPLPPVVAPGPGPTEQPPALATKFRLLLVSEDRQDPSRSTAIVASSAGDQRTVTVGDQLDGFGIVHIGVHGEGDERRARLVAARGEERVTLQTERSPRP